MSSRTLLLRGYKLKETKLDRFGKRPAATEAEEIGDQSTEVDVHAVSRSIEPFSFSFLYDCVTTLDLHFLLWKQLAKLLLDRFRSAWQKSITFFAARLAESSLRGKLDCGPLIEVLHRSCSWLNRKSSALPARALCAGSKVIAEKFAWASNPTRCVGYISPGALCLLPDWALQCDDSLSWNWRMLLNSFCVTRTFLPGLFCFDSSSDWIVSFRVVVLRHWSHYPSPRTLAPLCWQWSLRVDRRNF